MKYKLSFYRKVTAFALLLLLSTSSYIFSKACLDLTQSKPTVPMLHAMAPAHQVIKNGETIIDEEGSYHLLENIQGNIIIQVSNVVIDLNEFTISSDTESEDPLIFVDSEVTDVVIKNGALVGNCLNHGIVAYQPLAGTPTDIKRVLLQDLRISNVEIGIALLGDSAVLECWRVIDCRISHCSIGVDMLSAHKNIFRNVEVCCFTEDAFRVVACEYNKFEQCKAIRGGNGFDEDNDPNSGFYAVAGIDNLFYECFAEGICKEAALFCTKTSGFHFGFGYDPISTDTRAETESKIINCCVDSIVSSSWGNAVGVYLESQLLDEVTSVTVGSFFGDNNGTLEDVAWSPGCGFIALAYSEGGGPGSVKVVKFDGESLSGPVVNIPGSYAKVAWSANGRYLLYLGERGFGNEGDIVVRDMRTGKTVDENILTSDDQLTDIAWFNKSLSFVVSGTWKEYKFIVENGKINELQDEKDIPADEGIRSVAVTPDDCFVAKAVQAEGDLGTVVVYDSDDFSRIVGATALTGSVVNDVDWNPIACCDRRYLAVAGETNGTSNIEIFEFNGATLKSIATTQFDRVINTIKWSPRGKDFLVTSTAHNVGVFSFDPSSSGDKITQKLTYETVIGGSEPESAMYADWSPCGDHIVIAGEPSDDDDDYDVEVIRVGDTVTNCVVEGNRIANVCGGLCGLGIWGGGCCNLIDNNVVCCAGVPYSSGVYARYLGGLLGTAGYLENLYGTDYCVCCPCSCESRVCDCGCIPCSITDEPVI